MKKLRAIITITALSLFLSGMQSCYVHRDSDDYHHHGWFHRHDRYGDRDRDYDNNSDHRGGIIIVKPERHDRDDHDHNY